MRYFGQHGMRFFTDVSQAEMYIAPGEKLKVCPDTWETWHLIPQEKPVIQPPDVDEHFITVPGRHGSVNGSLLLHGRPVYKDRTGEISFRIAPHWKGHRASLVSEITNFLNGRELLCVLRDDRWYYYQGNFKVKSTEPDKSTDDVTISYRLYPFKYERWNGLKPFLWDDLDFTSGVIREGYDVAIATGDTGVIELLPIGSEARATLEIAPGSAAIYGGAVTLTNEPYYIGPGGGTASGYTYTGTYYIQDEEIVNGRVQVGPTNPDVALVQNYWIDVAALIKGKLTVYQRSDDVTITLILRGSRVYDSAASSTYTVQTGLRYPSNGTASNGRHPLCNSLADVGDPTKITGWLEVDADDVPIPGNGVLYGIFDEGPLTVDRDALTKEMAVKEKLPLIFLYVNESEALPCRMILHYRGERL